MTAAIAGPGNSIRPVVSTLSCQTVVRNRTPLSSIAAKPAKNRIDAPTARLKLRTRSIVGVDDRRLVTLGAPPDPGSSSAIASASSPITAAEVQPQSWPLTIASTSEPIATVKPAAPSRSGRQRRRARGARLGRCAPATSANSADRDVDEEHQPPVGLHEQASERWAGRGGDPAGRRPDADRRRGALMARTRAGSGRARSGASARRRRPGRAARAISSRDRRRRRAGRAREHEDRQPEQERALAPERVGPAPGRDEQRGEHDRVAADDPRQRARATSLPKCLAMLGKAMLTMNRSRLDMNTPEHTISGHQPFALHDETHPSTCGCIMQPTG